MRGFMRGILIFFFGGVIGAMLGIALGIFLFPYVFPQRSGSQQISEAVRTPLVASGSFIHADPADPVRYGKGRVSVYERALFLEPDFEVAPGPGFHVYLVPKEKIRSSEDLGNAMFIDLGPLRAFKGSQRYEIPIGLTLSHYPTVVIWSERFGILIAPADLAFASKSS